MLIRYARNRDLQQIYNIALHNKVYLGTTVANKGLIREAILKKQLLLAVSPKQKVLGFIYFRLRKDRILVIYDIVVALKRRKIGTKLVSKLILLMQKKLCTAVRLKCSIKNIDANLFYKKIGFKVICREIRYNKQKKRNSIYNIQEKKL
jgi:ribosomal protein S18 acetylase RimI-like enzyme